MMTITFFCQYLFSRDGTQSGHTSLLRQFIPQLIERGFNVEVISLGGISSFEAPCKVHILQNSDHQLDWSFSKKSIFWIKIFFKLSFYVLKNFRKLKNSKLVSLTIGASFVLPLFFRNVFIWENVAYFEKRPLIDKLRLRMMSVLKSTIVVPTEYEFSLMKKLFPSLNVRFIRNWYSPYLVKKILNEDSAPLLFMSAGFLQHRKGFDLLIKSINLIKSKIPSEVEFHIYGEGPEKENLLTQIKDHALENIVILKGIRNSLESIYPEYDVFILPSRLEGFPLVMINSLACGLPCIAFDCPTGPGQIIETGVNGILVEDGNTKELATAILNIINEEDISIYSKGAVDSTKDYSMTSIIDTWIDMMSDANSI